MRERLAGPRGEQTRQLGNAVPLRLWGGPCRTDGCTTSCT